MKTLELIFNLLSKKPIKMIFISFLVIILLAIGAQQVRMATGNDTLVSSDSMVYKENLMLENEFGGESVIVLYEAENLEQLLTISNLEHMKQLENRFQSKDEIFNIMSPVSVLEQIADKQSENYQDGIKEVIDGLDEMGTKLIEIGDNLTSKNGDSVPNMSKKLKELNLGISKMIEAQQKLNTGTEKLVNGYSIFGNQVNDLSLNLKNMAAQLSVNPNQEETSQQLHQISIKLQNLSNKMIEASEKSSNLPKVSEQTIQGLKGMEGGLIEQKAELSSLKDQQIKQSSDIQELGKGLKEMGENLTSISSNLNTMLTYSDTMNPGLPKSQETLEYMIYEDGEIRKMFSELIIKEKYMTMFIKFNSGVSDQVKSEVVSTIQSYMTNNPLEGIEVMVSGKPVLDDSIRSSMKESMQKMMMLSIIFMITVLSLVFKVKWRILPLGIILFAVIGTVGLMGWTNIPITMVSMAVFPILIGLGIDYAIQFQSRFSEEMKEGEVIDE